MNNLHRTFFNRSSLKVAPELLGKVLVRRLNDQVISGRIVEVEAYVAFVDKAAHSFVGRTKRNSSLFLSAGHAYIHSIHMQNCIDIVTDKKNIPSSVLIRALEPLEGINIMKQFRKKETLKDLTSGPGKLCQSLAITKDLDGIDLYNENSPIYLMDDGFIVNNIAKGTRIGISKAIENEYRFYISDNIFISKK